MLMNTTPQIDLFTHPLYLRLLSEHGFTEVKPDNFADFIQKDGLTMLLFIENPNRMKETMDALVIAPELAKACPLLNQCGVVPPPAARRLAVAYGFKRWPALVFLKSGAYLGAVDGLRLWPNLISETARILERTPSYPPSIGIEVRAG